MPKEIDVGANLKPLTRPSHSPEPADDASGAAAPASPADAARPASRKRRQPAGKKAAAGATSSPPARRSSQSKQRRTATPTLAPTEATEAPAASTGPRILAPATQAEAWRLTAYLHPDDERMLGLKKLDDGADNQARIRAMFAVYRSNSRFQQMVDRLAAAEPKRQGPRRNG